MNRPCREDPAPLVAIQPFLRDRGDDLAIDQYAGRTDKNVVTDAKNVHCPPHLPLEQRKHSAQQPEAVLGTRIQPLGAIPMDGAASAADETFGVRGVEPSRDGHRVAGHVDGAGIDLVVDAVEVEGNTAGPHRAIDQGVEMTIT